MTSDEVLIGLVQAGHSEALGELYDRYFDPIFRFCYYQTNKSQDAEDLTSEVMLAMSHGIAKFRAESSFKNWLYQIAKYKILAWVKEHKYDLPLLPLGDNQSYIDSILDPSTNSEKSSTRLQKLLLTLSSVERQILKLRYLKGSSIKETATKLGLSDSNVKVITHRAIKKLAELVT